MCLCVCVCVLVSLILPAEDLFIASSSVISGQDVGQSFIPLITYVKPALAQSLHVFLRAVSSKRLAAKESHTPFCVGIFHTGTTHRHTHPNTLLSAFMFHCLRGANAKCL